MRKHHKPKRSKCPWGENRIGKYSIEEIALEFILWEDEASHDDATKREFVQQALGQNFQGEDGAETLRRFGETYERLYEKLFRRRSDKTVMDPAPADADKVAIPTIKKQAA